MKKNATIILVLTQKKANPIVKPDFRDRKANNVGMFFVPKRKLSYIEIFASQKSVKAMKISSLIQSKQTLGSIISKCIFENNVCSTTSSPLLILATQICLFRFNEVFYGVRFGNVVCFIACFKYRLISVSQFLYHFKQVLGFCRGHFLVTNAVRLDFATTSWETPAWGIRFLSSIICKLCLWIKTMSDNFILIMYRFEEQLFVNWDFRIFYSALLHILIIFRRLGVLWRKSFCRGSC